MKTNRIIACITLMVMTATVSMAEWGPLVGRPELDKWIQKALMESSTMEMARERLQVSSMTVDSARADRKPTLNANLTVREGQEETLISNGETVDMETFSAGAEASWEVDVFGRIRAEVGAARFAETASEHALKDQELGLASDIVAHYVKGIYRSKQLRLQDEIVKANESIVKTLRGRHKAGLLSSQEIDSSIAMLQSSEQIRTAVSEAKALLAARWTYLVSTNGVPALSKAVDKNDLAPLPELPAQKMIHAYAVNRPDVRAAYALWQRADSSTAAASRRRLPSIQAVASAEGSGPSPVEDPETWSAWAGVRISLPVIAPKEGANVALEKAKARLEWAIYDEVTRRALLDIREAYVKRLHAEKKLLTAETTESKLRAIYEAEKRKHEKGLIIRSKLEQTRLAWLRSQETALALHAAALERHIEFIKSCGGPIAFKN